MIEQPAGGLDFTDAADHRQHDGQIVQPFAGPQHGLELYQEQFGVIQREPDPPPAKEGIFLDDGEIGQLLVSPHVQGPHADRAIAIGFQNAAIARRLLPL